MVLDYVGRLLQLINTEHGIYLFPSTLPFSFFLFLAGQNSGWFPPPPSFFLVLPKKLFFQMEFHLLDTHTVAAGMFLELSSLFSSLGKFKYYLEAEQGV